MDMRKNRRDGDGAKEDKEGGFDFMTAGSLMLHWGGYRVYSGRSLALRLFHRAFLAVVSVVTASFIALSFITMASPDFGKEAKMTTLGFLGNVTVAAWGPLARWATDSSLSRAIRLILSGIFSYDDNDEELRLQQKAIKDRIIKIIKLLHYYLTWVCLSSSIGNTFLMPFGHFIEGEHKSINNYLPILIYYPFDTRTYTGYVVAFLLDWLIWTQVYVVGISFILVYVGCCLQLTAEIEVLNDSLRNIERRARYIFEQRGYTADQEDLFDNEQFQNIMYMCLRQNVLHHRRILRLTELIRPYIESANACGIVVFSAILASDIFLILMNPRKNFMHIFAALAELFGYVQMCGVGEVITNSSKDTMYALYWTPWYRCNKKFNVTFQIIMTRTMKPVIFGSKFVNVPYSLETFANVSPAFITFHSTL